MQTHLDRHPDRPVTVAFIDIDKFKQVVDTYGHLNGSRAIAELAGVAKPLLPKGSFGVSYGGDEFVLVLDNHDGEMGGDLARRICGAIADQSFLASQGLSIRLTVSCGVASFPDEGTTMVDLLGNADHALFEAKRSGRNTVVTFADIKADPRKESFLPVDRS